MLQSIRSYLSEKLYFLRRNGTTLQRIVNPVFLNCNRCLQTQPESAFNRDRSRQPSGRATICRACKAEQRNTKVCKDDWGCGERKETKTGFYRDSKNKTRYRGHCKACEKRRREGRELIQTLRETLPVSGKHRRRRPGCTMKNQEWS